MARTTRKHLDGTLAALCKAAGLPLADMSQQKPRGLYISHEGGGYAVRRINADTSESDIFGATRRSAGDLWECMSFALQVLGAAHHAEVDRNA